MRAWIALFIFGVVISACGSACGVKAPPLAPEDPTTKKSDTDPTTPAKKKTE